jgi:pyridoxamine-phosphate oxidase
MELMTLTGNPDLVDPGFDHLPDNPLILLQKWFDTADRLKIIEPRGFVLSTVDDCGNPSSRVVLIKAIDEKGVVFATSEQSQKGKGLMTNPIAAGTVWWRETMQQINFSGHVTKLPARLSDQIFQERLPEAQAVAVLSHQSAPMTDEKGLREAVLRLAQQSGKISRPETWHAYYITIDSIEFWHGSRDRFHQRLLYEFKNDVWQHQKRQP